MMKGGVGTFNKKASEAYTALTESEKERLAQLSVTSTEVTTMSLKETVKAGTKAFKIIQKQVAIIIKYRSEAAPFFDDFMSLFY